MTLIESQAPGRRYYKAYLAEDLGGTWRGLADSLENPFAAVPENVDQVDGVWTDCISHGELIRSGIDERMEVDPDHLQFLFQGASRDEYAKSGGYAKIPWRLGRLRQH